MGLFWGPSADDPSQKNRDIALLSIEKIIDRLRTASQLEDIRGAIKGLKGFSRSYHLEVGSLAIRPLLDTIVGAIDLELGQANEISIDNIYPPIEDTETLIGIVELLTFIARPRDADPGIVKSPHLVSMIPFAEIIMKEDHDIQSLFSLLSMNEDFELRYQLLLLFEVLVEYDSFRLAEILLSSPVALSHLISTLSERNFALRDLSMLILAKVTKNRHHELQKIIAFQGIFDITFEIINLEGGITGSKVTEDALTLIGNLTSQNATNQRYFREIGGDQQLILLFRSAISGVNWNASEVPKLMTSDVASQLGIFLLRHTICEGLLSPPRTPSVFQNQNSLGIDAKIPLFPLLFDALQAAIAITWSSPTVKDGGGYSVSFNHPLSYTQPELIIGTLQTLAHLVQGHVENQKIFFDFSYLDMTWDSHLAFICLSPLLPSVADDSIELYIRRSALFVLASLGFHFRGMQLPYSVDTGKDELLAIKRHNSGKNEHNDTPTLNSITPVQIAILALFELEWEGTAWWPIYFAASILVSYLHCVRTFQNGKPSLLHLRIAEDGTILPYNTSIVETHYDDSKICNESHTSATTFTIVDLIMKFLRASNVSMSTLKISKEQIRYTSHRGDWTVFFTCKALLSLLVHLAQDEDVVVLLYLLTKNETEINISLLHQLIEWMSPVFDMTILGAMAAYIMAQLSFCAHVFKDKIENSALVIELIDTRIGIDVLASRLSWLKTNLYSNASSLIDQWTSEIIRGYIGK